MDGMDDFICAGSDKLILFDGGYELLRRVVLL